MQLTFLGTGTSFGVPVIGCRCPNCTSSDPRDRRTRHAALLGLPEGNLLVDTPPELRLQLVSCDVDSIGAVWYTHLHADHVHGIDDIRIFATQGRGPVTIYVPEEFAEAMVTRFAYLFGKDPATPSTAKKPRVTMRSYASGETIRVLGRQVTPFRVPHGPAFAYGFRVGSLGYVTDAKRLPSEARRILEGVSLLVLNALWWGKAHKAHFSVEEAIEAARSIGAERTFLTHMTHRLGYRELAGALPEGIEPAYDGLVVNVE